MDDRYRAPTRSREARGTYRFWRGPPSSIWSEHEASFHGEFYDFDRIWSDPKPIQRPRPPVLIGGEGDHVVDRVLSYGDGWMPTSRSTRTASSTPTRRARSDTSSSRATAPRSSNTRVRQQRTRHRPLAGAHRPPTWRRQHPTCARTNRGTHRCCNTRAKPNAGLDTPNRERPPPRQKGNAASGGSVPRCARTVDAETTRSQPAPRARSDCPAARS